MNDEQKLKRARRAIGILSVLLVILLILLLCLHSCIRKTEEDAQLSVSAGNYIEAPGEEEHSYIILTPNPTSSAQTKASPTPVTTPEATLTPTAVPETVTVDTSADTAEDPVRTDDGVMLSLYALHAGDSEAFSVKNMFPGDVVTKKYYVRAYCKNDITVNFRVTVREGYEKLSEVLMMRVENPRTGELIYDGLMCDMTETVSRQLKASRKGSGSLAYEITVYLDTSVGNEYMSLPLVADFEWWTNDRSSLVPNTSDPSQLLLFAAVFAAAGTAITVIVIGKRRRERREEE